jgi:hypothetical protein
MQERQGFPDFRIPNTRQPAGLFLWKLLDVASQGFDKQHLRQLRQHGLTTGSGRIGIVNRIAKRVFQPLAGGVIPYTDLQDGRQSAEKNLAQLRLAGQISANDSR